jgi:hypothetical protein
MECTDFIRVFTILTVLTASAGNLQIISITKLVEGFAVINKILEFLIKCVKMSRLMVINFFMTKFLQESSRNSVSFFQKMYFYVKFTERVETRERDLQRHRRQEARGAEKKFQVQRGAHRGARVHPANGQKHHSHQVAC